MSENHRFECAHNSNRRLWLDMCCMKGGDSVIAYGSGPHEATSVFKDVMVWYQK